MLFQVEMDVRLPKDLAEAHVADLKTREKLRAQELQKLKKWRHLWRVVGKYSNVSIFDVANPTELHEILSSLPLFPFMKIKVTAMCRHPSSIHEDDQ